MIVKKQTSVDVNEDETLNEVSLPDEDEEEIEIPIDENGFEIETPKSNAKTSSVKESLDSEPSAVDKPTKEDGRHQSSELDNASEELDDNEDNDDENDNEGNNIEGDDSYDDSSDEDDPNDVEDDSEENLSDKSEKLLLENTEIKDRKAKRERKENKERVSRTKKSEKESRVTKTSTKQNAGPLIPEITSILADGLNLTGRTRRREYVFGFIPLWLLANAVLIFIASRIPQSLAAFLILTIGETIIFLLGLPVTIRRFHDIGRSNKSIICAASLIAVLPLHILTALFYLEYKYLVHCMIIVVIIAAVLLLTFFIPLLCKTSESGENEWGKSPKEGENDKYADKGVRLQAIFLVAIFIVSLLLLNNSGLKENLKGTERLFSGPETTGYDYYEEDYYTYPN